MRASQKTKLEVSGRELKDSYHQLRDEYAGQYGDEVKTIRQTTTYLSMNDAALLKYYLAFPYGAKDDTEFDFISDVPETLALLDEKSLEHKVVVNENQGIAQKIKSFIENAAPDSTIQTIVAVKHAGASQRGHFINIRLDKDAKGQTAISFIDSYGAYEDKKNGLLVRSSPEHDAHIIANVQALLDTSGVKQKVNYQYISTEPQKAADCLIHAVNNNLAFHAKKEPIHLGKKSIDFLRDRVAVAVNEGAVDLDLRMPVTKKPRVDKKNKTHLTRKEASTLAAEDAVSKAVFKNKSLDEKQRDAIKKTLIEEHEKLFRMLDQGQLEYKKPNTQLEADEELAKQLQKEELLKYRK